MELVTYTITANPPILGIPQAGSFDAQDIIENFESLIWTERYFGDSEAQIIFPIDPDIITKLPIDMFIGIDESDELLMVDTITIQDNRITVKAVSVLTWLNNRFIRYAHKHKVTTHHFVNVLPGQLLWDLLYDMTNPNSETLTQSHMGIDPDYIAKLPIPEIGLGNYDTSDPATNILVTFAALYDEMLKIAQAFQIGIKILFQLKIDPFAEKPLAFYSYKGLDRTSTQTENELVRFSQDLNSLENLNQLKSGSIYKNIAFAFGSAIDFELSEFSETSGVAFAQGFTSETLPSGFGLRAIQVFLDDLSQYEDTPTDDDVIEVFSMLGSIAKNALAENTLIQAVDGDIIPAGMFIYGRDYSLGDLVEVEGLDGVLSSIRVTEHIISEDASGEKGYVTTGDSTDDSLS